MNEGKPELERKTLYDNKKDNNNLKKYYNPNNDILILTDKHPGPSVVLPNGGDRKNATGILENQTCIDQNIQMVFNVGGGKIQSSSWLTGKKK